MEWTTRFCVLIYHFSISLTLVVFQRQKTYRVLALLPKMSAAWLPRDCLASTPWATSNGPWCMGIKGEMSGTVCVTFTWDMYIWVVYSFCLFIIITWWYVWCIVWASGRVGVNSILELELQLNSNSNSGIEIGGIENVIGVENSGIGIENRNWIFCNCYHSIY